MLLVYRIHHDLVISRIRIHEGHELVPHSVIYQLINSWQCKAILRTSFVQVGEIDAGPPFPIWIWDPHGIGDLDQVFCFTNKPAL